MRALLPLTAVSLVSSLALAQPAPEPAPEPPAPEAAPPAPEPAPPPPAAPPPQQPGAQPQYPPGQYPPGQQPPPPPPGWYPPPYGYPYQQPPPPAPPPPPPPDTSGHRHDGFYLRMGIGIAYGNVVSESQTSVDFEVTYSGAGPAYELLIGGTLGSGFVLGGGLLGQDISEPDVEISSGSVSASTTAEDEALGVILLGPFVDWFIDETGGAHFGAMLGVGGIGLSDDSSDTSSGWGASVWGGYDFFISAQWSLGVEGRVLYVQTERDFFGNSFQDTATGYQLLFTALLH